MNRKFFVSLVRRVALPGLSLALLAGCGPRANSDEFGTIIHGIPEVPGSDKPYPLPQLDEPPRATEKAGDPSTEPAQPQESAPNQEEASSTPTSQPQE